MTDTPLCAVQYITDHPELSPYRLATRLPVSAQTIYRIRDLLGIRRTVKKRDRPPVELLAIRARWDVQQTAELMEAHGYGHVNMRKVRKLCGVQP